MVASRFVYIAVISGRVSGVRGVVSLFSYYEKCFSREVCYCRVFQIVETDLFIIITDNYIALLIV